MFVKKILVGALLSACYAISYAAEPLFLAQSGSKEIQGQLRAGLTQGVVLPFEGDASVISSKIGLRINLKAFDATEMTIALPNGKTISSTRINRYTTHGGSIVWVGKNTKASLGTLDYADNETNLVMRDGRIFGSVTVDGKRYMVRAASDNSHVVAEIQTKNDRKDHDERAYKALARTVPSFTTLVTPSMSRPANGRFEFSEYDQEKYLAQARAQFGGKTALAAVPSDYIPVVRILVNYTPAARSKIGAQDIQLAIDGFVNELNGAVTNSQSKVRFSLAYAAPVSYIESGNDYTDLVRYMDSTDSFMPEIHSQRQIHLADVAVLLNYVDDDACGISPVYANANQAFSVVDIGCAITQRSFSHEIGHLFGALHNVENDSSTVPFSYGHGFNQGQTSADRRSILAYAIGGAADKSPRSNVFSTPKVLVNGRPIGNTTTANNGRVLEERAMALSQFMPAPLIYYKDRKDFKISQSSTELYLQLIQLSASETIPRAGTASITFNDMRVNLNTAIQAKTIPADKLQSLIELYIAFMNRLPDSDGLEYWISEVKRGQTINQIAENFYNAAVLYSDLTGYSTNMSHTDFVIKVYKNVLARTVTASDSGVDYWAKELASGRQSRGQLVSSILYSAHSFKNDVTWGWVADLLDNKLAVGRYFSLQQGLSYRTPETSINKTMQMAAAVTPTDTSAAINILGLTDQLNLMQ